LLDSHDTPRIRTLLGGNDRLHRLAAIIQFTFPGVPCVYYGDEVGLQDEEGFGSRNCMPWTESSWNSALLDFYKRIIAYRKHSLLLQEGSFRLIYSAEDFILYMRSLKNEHILVTANRSKKSLSAQQLDLSWLGIENDLIFKALFSPKSMRLTNGVLYLPVIEQGGEIWYLN